MSLTNILVENISEKKLYQIAKKVREENEKYFDWENDKRCFKGRCGNVSKELEEKLNSNGFNAKKVAGMYNGANDNYVPDFSMWDEWEIDQWYEDKTSNDNLEYPHWWVEVNKKYIVDITADQFHPNEEDEYRIVITDINNDNYKKGVK